jgi:hypothetical protein
MLAGLLSPLFCFSPAMKSLNKSSNRFLLLGLASALLVGSATAAQAPERQRHANNAARLDKIHPSQRPLFAAVIRDLESHGDKPVIHADVFRSSKKQAQLKGKGVSKVGYSFHMVADRDRFGRVVPAALAADIIDNYRGYNVGDDFWLRVASSAQSHGLTTGIYWGLREIDRSKIRQLIQSKAWKVPYRRGWDPAHCQPQPWVITLSEAKRGKRPPFKAVAKIASK